MNCVRDTSSLCFDIIGSMCVSPCIILGSFCQCGPYNGTLPVPQKKNVSFITDRWYKASIHTLHGGSLLQLLATHSIYWRFPLIKKEGNNLTLGFKVKGKNRFGNLFSKLIESQNPTFRVRIINENIWSVRLNIGSVKLSSSSLNDVWRVSRSGSIITSIKTRGRSGDCTCGIGTGPAMFVEAFDELDDENVKVALMERF